MSGETSAAEDYPVVGTEEETSAATIYELLPLVARDVGAVGKNKANQQQRYKFRAIDDVLEALHPALIKHGVVVVPRVLSKETTEFKSKSGGFMRHILAEIEHRFYGPAGDFVECVTFGEAMDTADKAANKAMAAAWKYAVCLSLCIPVDLPDADEETPEVEPLLSRYRSAASRMPSRDDNEVPYREQFGATVKDMELDRVRVAAELRERYGVEPSKMTDNQWERACQVLPDIAASIRGVGR